MANSIPGYGKHIFVQKTLPSYIWSLGNDWHEGEAVLVNHPSAGGSHLPDMTVITPVSQYILFSILTQLLWKVFQDGKPVFYVASRGHHADIGGITPGIYNVLGSYHIRTIGSMPPFSTSLEEEGVCIKSFKIVVNGEFKEKELIEILKYPKSSKRKAHQLPISGSRTIRDNISDLKAQASKCIFVQVLIELKGCSKSQGNYIGFGINSSIWIACSSCLYELW